MAITLIDLLVRYESRKSILQQLSAWDVAKLDLCLGFILDEQERKAYLNPIRDLSYHVVELNSLLKGGMKLVLLGNDVPRFYKRLKYPGRYAKRTNGRKHLHLHLLGMFSVQLEKEESIDRMIKFCLYDNPDPARVHYDKRAFEAIKSQRPNGLFLTSFGVPIHEGRIEDRGFWHTCQEIPDVSIKLKLYVPCFTDRLSGEASLKLSELSGVSGHTLNLFKLRTAWVFLCIRARMYTLESAICFYVQKGEEEQMAQVGSALSIRFPYTKSILRNM